MGRVIVLSKRDLSLFKQKCHSQKIRLFDCNGLRKCINVSNHPNRVPTRTGKPGKMGRHFPVREKSGNFEQTGKVREKSGKITQNTGKLREFQTNIIIYFLVIFKLTVYYFVEMHRIFSYKINF